MVTCCSTTSFKWIDSDTEPKSRQCCYCMHNDFKVITTFKVQLCEQTCEGCGHRFKNRNFDVPCNYVACNVCDHSCAQCCAHPLCDLLVTTSCNVCQATVADFYSVKKLMDEHSRPVVDTLTATKCVYFPGDAISGEQCRVCGYLCENISPDQRVGLYEFDTPAAGTDHDTVDEAARPETPFLTSIGDEEFDPLVDWEKQYLSNI